MKNTKKYTIEQFIKDCKKIGWREDKVVPQWNKEMNIETKEEDMLDVLMFKYKRNAGETIMEYSPTRGEQGVEFGIYNLGNTLGQGMVTNTEDLYKFMKVARYYTVKK